jgi:hypothetical protein
LTKLTRRGGIWAVATRARSVATSALTKTIAAISCAPVSTV